MIEVNPRVKDALRSGAYRKNYRINVLNDDGTTDFTLNNTELVSESVKIDERMCSGDTLKFGLCEGSSIEFQYFNHDNINHPNIRGRRIQVFVDVQYKDVDGELDWCAIPLGFFDIQECSTQFSTGIMKVVGYNKLRSEYLDQKANDILLEVYEDIDPQYTPNPTIDDILREGLQGFAIVNSELFETAVTNCYTDNSYQYRDQYGEYGTIFIYTAEIKTTLKIPDTITQSDDWYSAFVHGGVQVIVSGEALSTIYTRSRGVTREDVHGFVHNPTFRIEPYYEEITGDDIKTPFMTNCKIAFGRDNGSFIYSQHEVPDNEYQITFSIASPISFGSPTDETRAEFAALVATLDIKFLWTPTTMMGDIPFSDIMTDMPDVTFRELQSAVFEASAEFGQLSRVTDLFEGVSLSRERLFPADDLHPSDTLYPQGVSESTFKSMYEKLWTDSVGEQKFRKLYITYKGLDEEQKETEFVLERTVNADGTTDYYCDDNWLFKNLVWTAEQVGAYADAMVLKMRGIKWFPFEMWSAGLPYIEVGDELEIISKDGTYTSYVLQRNLTGIQNLKDKYINGSLDIF